METLATLFVSLVTLANSIAPSTQINRILSFNPANPHQAVLSEMDESSGSATATLPRKEKVRNLIEKRIQERQQKIDSLRQTRQTKITENQTRREEFKEKLATIKDERKQAIVEKIDANLAQHNTKWVTKWNDVLTRLSSLLVKIETRTETAKENGKDTQEIEAAIADAKSAIEVAQTAVTTQSEKTYTITISSESNLGQDVKTTINSFHNDIKNTKDSVEAARRSVMSVVSLLKTTNEESEE